jgi:hypothetical protein
MIIYEHYKPKRNKDILLIEIEDFKTDKFLGNTTIDYTNNSTIKLIDNKFYCIYNLQYLDLNNTMEIIKCCDNKYKNIKKNIIIFACEVYNYNKLNSIITKLFEIIPETKEPEDIVKVKGVRGIL